MSGCFSIWQEDGLRVGRRGGNGRDRRAVTVTSSQDSLCSQGLIHAYDEEKGKRRWETKEEGRLC